jgi:hypothetical protein
VKRRVVLAVARWWRKHRIGKRILGAYPGDSDAGEFFTDEETQVLQGKVTYASIAVLALSWLAQRFDVPLLPEDAEAFVAAIGAVIGTLGGVYGRYRATKPKV